MPQARRTNRGSQEEAGPTDLVAEDMGEGNFGGKPGGMSQEEGGKPGMGQDAVRVPGNTVLSGAALANGSAF
ncbi:UNVERIFIED_CONTAM: hypothetical protein K2H54_042444 [Gekko kuhli]